MADRPQTFWQFWLGVFSEPDGAPSYSRVLSAIFILFMLVLDVLNYVKTGQLPNAADLLAQGAAGNAGYLINQTRRLFAGGTNPGGPEPLSAERS